MPKDIKKEYEKAQAEAKALQEKLSCPHCGSMKVNTVWRGDAKLPITCAACGKETGLNHGEFRKAMTEFGMKQVRTLLSRL